MLGQEVVIKLRAYGRMDANTNDFNSKTHRTGSKGVPTWEDVAYRVIAEETSGDIINIENATSISRAMITDCLTEDCTMLSPSAPGSPEATSTFVKEVQKRRGNWSDMTAACGMQVLGT